MYISLFLGVPMGVPIYNLWGARGVCSPQTTWSSSCSQNIWGVALWTRFLASYRLLCRQKMTWFWHCHKHILVITQFENHRHSYVIVYRDIMYIYMIYWWSRSGILTNDPPAAGAVQDFEDEKYFYLVMDCTFLWRMLVLNNQEDQSLLHVATAKRQEQCRGGDLAEYVWRAQPCEGETSSEQSGWTRNELMKPSCSGFLLYVEFIYFSEFSHVWTVGHSFISYIESLLSDFGWGKMFGAHGCPVLWVLGCQGWEQESHHPNFAQRLEWIFRGICFFSKKPQVSEKKPHHLLLVV